MKHRIGIAAFTANGRALAQKIQECLQTEYEFLIYEKGLHAWCQECFAQAEALIFIGACGIAVRTIAPFLKSKTEDPAVVVLDEKGQYVISLLSGHIGGANDFALKISEMTGAIPVITTASDVNGKIAVDVFAKKNDLVIDSMKKAKEIASAILQEKKVGVVCEGEVDGPVPSELELVGESGGVYDALVWISECMPDPKRVQELLRKPDAPVLHLIPRTVVLGLGCRKEKGADGIRSLVQKVLADHRISPKSIVSAASIDLKKEEQGILTICEEYQIPFTTYTAEELLAVEGDFESSDFVRKTTGVDNVCERSALKKAGADAVVIQKKIAENGVTAALASRKWRVRFEK